MGLKLKSQPPKFITPGANNYLPNDSFVKTNSPRPINLNSNRADFSKSVTGVLVGPGNY
jgi:hypothetical protein